MSVNRASLLSAVVAAENAADGAYARLVFALSVTVADVAGLVKELTALAMSDPDAEGRIAALLMVADPAVAATFEDALTALLAGDYADADVAEATARVRKGYANKFRNGLNRALGKTPMNTKTSVPTAESVARSAGLAVKAGASPEDVFRAVASVLGLNVIPGTVVTSGAGMPTRAPEVPSKGRARIRGTKSPRVVS